MNHFLPYNVSYSDGCDYCKKCSNKILNGSLKLAIMMQSDVEDCRYAAWFHVLCFFRTRLPASEALFNGFAKLRYADQRLIKQHLGTDECEQMQCRKTDLFNFGIEYAKSSRNMCVGCTESILLNEIQIMNVINLRDENNNCSLNAKAIWYHIECFSRCRMETGWMQSAELLPGFKRLSPQDKTVVASQIPILKLEIPKTIETRSNDELNQLNKLIESQNIEYFKWYDKLFSINYFDQKAILKANEQLVPRRVNDLIHHLTDVIYFGALKMCNKCQTGKLYFNNWTYLCAGDNSAWAKCSYEVKEPLRSPVIIPEHIAATYCFLNETFCVRTRALHSFKLFDRNDNDLLNEPYKDPPLFNMEFVLIGKVKSLKSDIERRINKLGGRVVKEVYDQLAAVISNEHEVQRMGRQMTQAKESGIQVVGEDFIRDAEHHDPIMLIISQNICNWGDDPFERIERNNIESRNRTSFYTKSIPQVMTYKWKVETAVDPKCGLNEVAHVFSTNYSVTLGLVDVEKDRNSFYRMQLLHSNDSTKFWVSESWGRISTSIGSKYLTSFDNIEDAKTKFESVYFAKTGNNFGDSNFIKKANKFYLLDIDHEVAKQPAKKFVPTKLSEPVFKLMQLLFNIDEMEKMMLGCDLDLKQMPLGKISSKQIYIAMDILKQIERIIQKNGEIGEIRGATNQFYTMIPHAFGVKSVPLIDSLDIIRDKYDMLESLLNMELVYGILNDKNDIKINPFDSFYNKLNVEMTALDKQSHEFRLLCDVIQNTHGHTHQGYKIHVEDIFKVARNGEEARFQPFEHLHRQLLFHGSRLPNFVSILTNGLKIAPPEAPHSGYMFGKGIYFADCVSKSANYCHIMGNDSTGLLLMCDVALGTSKELYSAENITCLPANIHSVKGCGSYCPSKFDYSLGLPVPIQFENSGFRRYLQYNEFIVYNTDQVKIQYLFKIKLL